jgi:hypothetical protein
MGYWRAFRQLRPHRSMPPAQLGGLHVLHEQLASNRQLAEGLRPSGFPASGSRLRRFAEVCQLPAGVPLALVHLQQALVATDASAALLGRRLLQHVRPAPWRPVLDGSGPGACI